MEFSTMLKGIRSEFEPCAEGMFVCVSLEKKYGSKKVKTLLEFIHKSLGCREGTDEGEYTTVFDWMREHHWKLYEEEFQYNSLRQQEYRLAWIDQMIAMFKAEGN